MSDLAPPDSAWPAPASPARPARWRDLAAYLLLGIGLFVLAGQVLRPVAGEPSLLLSVVAYSLNVVCLAGSAYLLGVRWPGRTWREFGLRPYEWRWLAAALTIAVAIVPVRIVAALIVQVAVGGLEQLQPRLDVLVPGGAWSGVGLAITLLGAGLAAPVAEELYFRGLLHTWFWVRLPGNPWLRVLLSSTIFAASHYDSPGVVAASFFLGLVCAAAYERSRSLWPPIIVHAANNSAAVILAYVALRGS